ncbi:polysaccharide lyase family 14 protein [Irpex lacteus]|nr:polysaccharide lyase family 14 protein [Irpex lacteus]
MTDLASFNISYFPYGQDNVAIVNGTTTANASADNLSLATAATGTANTESSNSSAPPQPMMNGTDAALQLFYPAGSINPESEPQGGADFYASPIDLSKANNVTLEYSVYFPADFDWVLAGKLPGLYGGHSGCSGGNDARSCFSTRLMWRAKGAGELYLYAPKDKQTKELCSAPPQSVCDQEYGLSVGRGSFNFTPGAWTHVRQTVTLNTPGGQDGGFVLEVNGQEVMRRADVFYRGVDTTSEPSFFGGHEEKYASPRDQYTWFKDFALTVNG